MFANCIGQVSKIPEGVQDLDTLNLWLRSGTYPRFCIVEQAGTIQKVRVCNSLEEVSTHATVGCKIVTIRKFERSSDELLQWIKTALKRKEFIQC